MTNFINNHKPPQKKIDEEQLHLEIREDRRLKEMGINPNDDPIKIMNAIAQKYEELQKDKK